LALVALAFTVFVAPSHVRRARAWVHALAVADLLIPHKAKWAVLGHANALTGKDIEVFLTRASSQGAMCDQLWDVRFVRRLDCYLGESRS
jgi:hypothetical protein